MMSEIPTAPWHKHSFEELLQNRLPELIASRLPLESYTVVQEGTGTCAIELGLKGGNGTGTFRIAGIPLPDEEGIFPLEGQRIVVLPVASEVNLERAQIQCVGEQIFEFIEPRLGEAPPELPWTEELVRSWLPLDRWIIEFLDRANQPWDWSREPRTSQILDEQNPLARIEHLRRILVLGERDDT
ncbi:MAG: hypothetical protein ACYTHM_22370, partial [Planctomycetota bacterium]